MVGLSNGDTNQDVADIDFALYARFSGTLEVYEGGTYKGGFGSYAANDRLRVEVRYGAVRYFKNGTLFYTSAGTARYPLRVDTALYTTGATITDAKVGNLTWTDGSNVAISGDSLSKTGTNSAWDAGAISTNSIESGDGFVEFTATETDKARIAGLANGNTDNSLSDIEFGIELRSDGVVEIFESGTSRGTAGSYSSGDRLRVELKAGIVKYYVNGSAVYTSGVTPTYPLRVVRYLKNGAVLYTSSTSPSYPLHGEAAMYSVGGTLVDVAMGNLVWFNAVNTVPRGRPQFRHIQR